MLVEYMVIFTTFVFRRKIYYVSVTVVVPKPQWYEMRIYQNDKEIYQVINIVLCIVCCQQGYELTHGSIMVPHVSS